ncbi:Hypothetical protein I5071_69330 [Sandaracinus amylolyticus]|nr:Hypothetical protein I5071_69330 [Sandaracinus amylolyticus]
MTMRPTFALLISSLVLLGGCSSARERVPEGGLVDSGPAHCARVATFRDGDACDFDEPCVIDDGCCATTWTCESRALVSAARCGLPGCYSECDDALESAEHGDPCEGAFFCSQFDDRLCCSHSVECVGGRVQVEDECPPACD